MFKAYDYRVILKGAQHPDFSIISGAKLMPLLDYITAKIRKTVDGVVEKEKESLKEPTKLSDENHKKHKGFYGTSLPLIPNIRNSIVEVGSVNPLLFLFGIQKRKGTTVTLFTGPNGAPNKYLRYQYRRAILSIGGTFNGKSNSVTWTKIWKNINREDNSDKRSNKQKREDAKNVRRFWAIATNLLINSKAFRVALFCKILGRSGRWFHRDLSLPEILKLNENYLKLVKVWKQKIPVQRMWINQDLPNGEKKYRPLGFAPIAWRFYTGGLAAFLETFLANGTPKHQHGYTSGRGVHTAWKFILKFVIKAKFIYEFDLVGYFNNISHKSVGSCLHKFHVPNHIIIHLLNLSSSDISNINETGLLKLLTEKSSTWSEFWKKHEYIHKFAEGFRSRGFAQGFSLSPILSVLPLICLDRLKENGLNYVLYADDGIIYGCEAPKPLDYHALAQSLLDEDETGVTLHAGKSRWVKYDDKWLYPLKFVGLIYDSVLNKLSACTRNGATLPMEIILTGLVSKKSILDSRLQKAACSDDLYIERPLGFAGLDISRVTGSFKEDLFNYYLLDFYQSMLFVYDSCKFTGEDLTSELVNNNSFVWSYFEAMKEIDSIKALNILSELSDIIPTRLSLFDIMTLALSLRKSPIDKWAEIRRGVSEQPVQLSELELRVDLLCWYKTYVTRNNHTSHSDASAIGELIGNTPPHHIPLPDSAGGSRLS
jgi:hypothetical protein